MYNQAKVNMCTIKLLLYGRTNTQTDCYARERFGRRRTGSSAVRVSLSRSAGHGTPDAHSEVRRSTALAPFAAQHGHRWHRWCCRSDGADTILIKRMNRLFVRSLNKRVGWPNVYREFGKPGREGPLGG